MVMDIKIVGLECVLPLRALELRAGLCLSKAILKEDRIDNIKKKHFALFLDKHICACLSLYKITNNKLGEAYPWQLRAMAVDRREQGKAYGSKLLQSLLNGSLVEKNNIWCNAREKALSFYQKHGFKKQGDIFSIKDIGPHYLAYYKGDKYVD